MKVFGVFLLGLCALPILFLYLIFVFSTKGIFYFGTLVTEWGQIVYEVLFSREY